MYEEGYKEDYISKIMFTSSWVVILVVLGYTAYLISDSIWKYLIP